MSVNNFIPTIWSAQVMENLHKMHVAVATANRRYEGEIAGGGGSVKIQQVGAVSVRSNSSSLTYDEPQDNSSILLIDQEKVFGLAIDDVDKAQANVEYMQELTAEASYALADTADAFLLGKYGDAGMLVGTDASPIDINSANIEDNVLAIGELMHEANIPSQNRFMVIPPWFHTKLLIAGLTTKTANDALFANGFIDMVLGFKMRMSNNVSIGTPATGAQTRIIAGVEGKTFAYAEQIVETEALRDKDAFKDYLRGLHVYGGKVLRPDMTATLYCDKTAEA